MPDPERIPSSSHVVDVRGVPVFRWQPRRFAALPEYQPENFGDSLAADLVQGILGAEPPAARPATAHRLLSVGSVLHFAEPLDVVWGSGVNGKIDDAPVGASSIDVRAVRGPKTRDALLELGIPAPSVFGDPGLLVPLVFPETAQWAQEQRHRLAVVPNFNDARDFATHPEFVNPLAPLWDVIRRIAHSELVIASSLHGIVIAEALGIPVRPLRSKHEPSFKYDDYALGTGRDPLPVSETLEDALRAGPIEPLDWSPAALLEAFPHDLWQPVERSLGLHVPADADAGAASETLTALRAQAGERDEILISLASRQLDARRPIERARAEDARIRVRWTGALPSADEPWGMSLAWARGATLSVTTAADELIGEELVGAHDALAETDACALLARVVEHGSGPDDDRWRGALAAPTPALRGHEARSGAVLSPTRVRAAGLTAPGGPLPLLAWPLTALATHDAVLARHRRRPPSPLAAPEITALLGRFAAELASLDDAPPSVVRSVLEHAADAVRASPGADVAGAARSLIAVVAAADADGAWSGSPAGRALALRALGLDARPSLDALLACRDELEGQPAALLADSMLGCVPGIAAELQPDRLGDLRALAGALGAAIGRDGSRRTGPGCSAAGGAAWESRVLDAVELGDTAFALACLADDAIVLEHAAPTPVGFIVAGRMPALLTDSTLQLWSSDAGRGTRRRVGTLRAGRPVADGISFAGHVRHAFAPAGLLTAQAADSRHPTGLLTTRLPGRRVVEQLLRPVEIPLDGGAALLIRRPSPVDAIRARLRH